jgi:hypothetical protein
MPRVDYGELASLQASWQNNPMIPEWKKVGMGRLLEVFRRRVADNHNKMDGVRLYYPEDCREYDVFISVVNALDALVVPTSNNGLIASHFGKYGEIQ